MIELFWVVLCMIYRTYIYTYCANFMTNFKSLNETENSLTPIIGNASEFFFVASVKEH